MRGTFLHYICHYICCNMIDLLISKYACIKFNDVIPFQLPSLMMISCIFYCETTIPKALRSGIGKLNNPAQRRVMRTKLALWFIPVIEKT